MLKPDVDKFFEILSNANPLPVSELDYKSPYTFLVAVVLSAQATDKSVNKATRILYAQANTPQQMLELGEERLKDAIKSVGLANTKTKNILALSKQLIERFAGVVPNTMEGLISLPGVGRKTANVVLNCLYEHSTIAVDTHVFRVANRTGLAEGPNPLQVENKLMSVVPEKYLRHAHHWLILHGRYVCKAIKPLCLDCPVNHLCAYYKKLLMNSCKKN